MPDNRVPTWDQYLALLARVGQLEEDREDIQEDVTEIAALMERIAARLIKLEGLE